MKVWFCIISLFVFSHLLSQSKTNVQTYLQEVQNHTKEDTIKVQLLLKLAASYYGVDTEKLNEVAQDAHRIASKLNYKNGIAEALKLQGAASHSKGDFKTAESLFTQALNIYKEINYYPGIIVCYSNLGSMKLIQNSYPEALKLYQISIRYAEKSKDFKNSAMAYGNMGIIYSELKNYDLALSHFNEALKSHQKSEYSEGVASSYSNIGTVYFNQNDFKTALQYYKLALDKNREINNQLGIAREYGNIASLYMKQKSFVQAFDNLNSALKINSELNNKKGIAVNYQGLGEYYLYQNKPNDALKYFLNANKIAAEIGVKDIQKDTYKNLSEMYERNSRPDSAYFYYKKYIDVKETIDNENNRKQISRMEIQYEFDAKEEKYKNQQLLDLEHLKQKQLLLDINGLKLSESNKERDLASLNYLKTEAELKNEQLESNAQKKQLDIAQKEIELRQKELKINKLTLESRKRERVFYLIGIGLLAVIGSMLLYQSQNRKKSNENLLKLNSELDLANKNKLRFLGILNHDLRSPVSKLIHFLHLQKENPELLDEETKERMEAKTMFSAQNLLESMEEILLWSKGQMENFTPNFNRISVNTVFTDLQKHFYSSDVPVHFENKENLEITTDENYLKTIMRNLTGNAIKATESIDKPSINWKAWKENNSVFLSISDNGKGGSEESFKALMDEKTSVGIQSGLGLHLVRDLAKAINCQIEIDSEINHGTIITLILNP